MRDCADSGKVIAGVFPDASSSSCVSACAMRDLFARESFWEYQKHGRWVEQLVPPAQPVIYVLCFYMGS